MEKITGSEALLRALIAEGVDTIFGYPGGAVIPVYDCLYDYKDKLKHVLVRHEQGATHAAQGYARVSGKVGVALVTSGPGATLYTSSMHILTRCLAGAVSILEWAMVTAFS